MAIYHASTSAISRSNGHSVTAKSAYISCCKLTDNLTGEIHNYENKKGLEHSEIILPEGIDKKITTEELWNKAELAEKRKDARVGREWVIALPHELNREQRIALAKDLSQELANRYEVATQYAIHEPAKEGDQRNYHIHILTTTRKINQELNLTDKSDIERDRKQCAQMGIPTSQEQIVQCREMIANKINVHLEMAHIQEKVTHKSYEELGISQLPTRHLGKEATHLERKGELTEIGNYNRQTQQYNMLKQQLDKATKELFNIQQENIKPSVNDLVRDYFIGKEGKQPMFEKPMQNNEQGDLLKSILEKHGNVDEIVKSYKESEEQLRHQQQKVQEKAFIQELSIKKGREFSR